MICLNILTLLLINLVAVQCDLRHRDKNSYESMKLIRELQQHSSKIDQKKHNHNHAKPVHYRTIIREYSMENQYESMENNDRIGRGTSDNSDVDVEQPFRKMRSQDPPQTVLQPRSKPQPKVNSTNINENEKDQLTLLAYQYLKNITQILDLSRNKDLPKSQIPIIDALSEALSKVLKKLNSLTVSEAEAPSSPTAPASPESNVLGKLRSVLQTIEHTPGGIYLPSVIAMTNNLKAHLARLLRVNVQESSARTGDGSTKESLESNATTHSATESSSTTQFSANSSSKGSPTILETTTPVAIKSTENPSSKNASGNHNVSNKTNALTVLAAVQQLARSFHREFDAFKNEQNERMDNITRLLNEVNERSLNETTTVKPTKAAKAIKRDTKKKVLRRTSKTETKDNNNIPNKIRNNTPRTNISRNAHNGTLPNTQNQEKLDQKQMKSRTRSQTDKMILNNTYNGTLNNTQNEESSDQKLINTRAQTQTNINPNPVHLNITHSNDKSNDLENKVMYKESKDILRGTQQNFLNNTNHHVNGNLLRDEKRTNHLSARHTDPKQAPIPFPQNDRQDILPPLPYHKITIYRAQRRNNRIEYPLR